MGWKRFFAGTPLLLVIVLSLFFTGCNSKKKSEVVKNYAYMEDGEVQPLGVKHPALPWLTEGTVCYGLVVGIDSHGRMVTGLPVKSKVTTILKDSIKMKALEKVNLAEAKGCTKMGISRGEIWWETEDDLFQTREEAITWLREKGILFGEEKAPQSAPHPVPN